MRRSFLQQVPDNRGEHFAGRAGILACLLVTFAPLAATQDGPAQTTHDGLELVPDTKVMVAWVNPDADFSIYKRVMILEAPVSFRKNWQLDQNRQSVSRVSTRDMQRIKDQVSQLFHEVFAKELSSDGGPEIVDAPDTDVLLLRPTIFDLDVTAPEPRSTGRSRSLTTSSGAASLLLEMFDSVSGDILARAIDRQTAGRAGDFMRITNEVTNRADAERVFASWAKLLRESFEELSQ